MSPRSVRADLTATEVRIGPGEQGQVDVEVTNVSEVIRAYRVDVLGLDPTWVTVSGGDLELFPGERRSATILLDLPAAFPAGRRRVAIEVSEPNDPAAADGSGVIVELDVVVARRDEITFGVEPASMTVGAEGTFVVTPVNAGNATIDLQLSAADPERKVQVAFDPPVPRLLPGERGIVRATARGPRPWFGMPLVRVIEFRARAGDSEAFSAAALIQTPRFSRRLVTLAGLVAVATLFAFVIFLSFSSVADLSAQNEALLKQSLGEDQPVGVRIEPSSVTGRVTSTTGGGIDGASVELYSMVNPLVPMKTTVTDAEGLFRFGSLAPDTYFVRFQVAGFGESWFRRGTNISDATPLELVAGEDLGEVDVMLGGQPGSIVGTVVGEDVAGALVVAQIPGSSFEGSQLAPVASRLAAAEVDATGAFILDGLPTPAAYEVVVTKSGFAPQVRTIALDPGEVRRDLEILLRRGGGVIAGRVVDGQGTPIGGAVLVVSDGQTEVRTRTLSEAEALGTFDVRELPTPGTYSLTVETEGFFTETQTIVLGQDQQLTGRTVRLTASLGSVTGRVVDTTGAPLGGITVTVLGPGLRVTTETLSTPVGFVPSDVPPSALDASGQYLAQAGTWRISGLPVPGAYTVSFSAPGQRTQSVSVELTAGAGSVRSGVNATLDPSTGTVSGRVFEATVPSGNQAASVTQRVLAGGTATLTTALGHGLAVGDAVTVSGVGAPFNGTHRVTAVATSTTFSFAVTGADVAAGPVSPAGQAARPISGVDGVVVTLRSTTVTRTLRPDDQPLSRHGTYRFDGVPPGAYTLTITRPGASTQTILVNTANLARFSDLDRRVILGRPATVTGRVRPFSGFPDLAPRRYAVRVFDANAIGVPLVPEVLTGFDGRFTVAGLPAPGRYVFEFEDRETGVRTLIPSPDQRTVELGDVLDLEPGVPVDLNVTMLGPGATEFYPFTAFELRPTEPVLVVATAPTCDADAAGDLYIDATSGTVFYCTGVEAIRGGTNPQGPGRTPGTTIDVGSIRLVGPPAPHGPATRLRFVTQPSSRTWDATLSGARLTPAGTVIRVEVVDGSAESRIVTTGPEASSTISLRLTLPGPGNTDLVGETVLQARGGVAVFDDLTVLRAGSGYRLVASSGALTSATSSQFNVSAIAPAVPTLVQLQPPVSGGGWTVQWAGPFADGGADITHYLIESVGSTASTATLTSCVGAAAPAVAIPGAVSGRPVYFRNVPGPLVCEIPAGTPATLASAFRVHAVNAVGERSQSALTPTGIAPRLATTTTGVYRVLGTTTTSGSAFVERGWWFQVERAVTVDQLLGGGASGSDWRLRLTQASSPLASGTALATATVAGTACGAERPAASIAAVTLQPGTWYRVTAERASGSAYHCEAASAGTFQVGTSSVGTAPVRFGGDPNVPVGFRVSGLP